METLSVIIPALNEAESLPPLLAALRAQTRPPDEIIVADAGSTDGTVALAEAAGARVVPGGRPAAGRNAGASAAVGSLLLFLDADVLPEPEFIERFVGGFVYQQLAAATCLIAPIGETKPLDTLLCNATNVYLQAVQQISPHAPGFCILIRREMHKRIGGFDESAIMAEDHEYVHRAAQYGDFGVLPLVSIPVSLRRLEKEGLVRLALKYTYCELHALAGQPVRSMPFVYEFGNFTPASAGSRSQKMLERLRQAPRVMDIAWLRDQMGRFENPLGRLSARSLRTFRPRDVHQEDAEAFDTRLSVLLPEELRTLDHYLTRRLALFQHRTRSFWRSFITRMQDPLASFEGLRFLDGREPGDDDPLAALPGAEDEEKME